MRRLLFTVCLLALFLTGYGQEQRLLQYLPGEATLVTAFHHRQLAEKLDIASFKTLPFAQELRKTLLKDLGEQMTAQLWDDPREQLGIDLSAGMFLFAEAHMAGDSAFFGMVLKVDNHKKWVSALKEVMADRYKEQFFKGKKHQGVTLGEGMLVAWNKEALVFLDAETPLSRPALREKATRLFTQKQGMKNHSNFMQGLEQNADLFTWVDLQRVNKEAFGALFRELGGTLKEENRKKAGIPDMDDQYQHLYTNFVNGRIQVGSKTFVSEAYADLNRRVTDNTFNPELAHYLARDRFVGGASVSLNMQESRDWIEPYLEEYLGQYGKAEKNYREAMDTLLRAYNTSYEEAWQAFEGDMILAFNGLTQVETTYIGYEYDINEEGDYVEIEKEMTRMDDQPLLTLLAKLNKEVDWLPVMEKLVAKGLFIKKAGYYEFIKGNENETVYLAITPKHVLIVSNDEEVVHALPNGYPEDQRISPEVWAKISTHPVNLLLDIPLLLGSIKAVDKHRSEAAEKRWSLTGDTFERLFFYSKRSEGDVIEAESGLTFFAKKDNSLKVLSRYLNDLYLLFR